MKEKKLISLSFITALLMAIALSSPAIGEDKLVIEDAGQNTVFSVDDTGQIITENNASFKNVLSVTRDA